MDTRSAVDILQEAGVTERQAWAIVAVFFWETWPRIDRMKRLQKLGRGKAIGSVVRCIPWPHVAAYNSFLEKLATARTMAELKPDMLAVKEQIARRLLDTSIGFAFFGHQTMDKDAYGPLFRSLTRSEIASARQSIISILRVGEDGNCAGNLHVPHWLFAWQRASERERRQSSSAPSGTPVG